MEETTEKVTLETILLNIIGLVGSGVRFMAGLGKAVTIAGLAFIGMGFMASILSGIASVVFGAGV